MLGLGPQESSFFDASQVCACASTTRQAIIKKRNLIIVFVIMVCFVTGLSKEISLRRRRLDDTTLWPLSAMMFFLRIIRLHVEARDC